ncbi:MAG: hypothetical protein IPJ94_10285 [Chloroflexi bacterium]|nr:hypothetical protein [Chloroflexota bacterium]
MKPSSELSKPCWKKYATITERESTVDQIITDVVNAVGDENRFRDPDDQLMLPSERTIRRRIKAAGERRIPRSPTLPPRTKVSSRNRAGSTPHTILERVEIDHTTLNLFVVDEQDGLPIGRPYITACIDKYSALVPGWHIGFNQGGYESIMLCLQHAFRPNQIIVPYMAPNTTTLCTGCLRSCALTTAGISKSADLKNALAELGIIREEMPKETPWFKGSIERYFRSVNQRLLKGKPGYTFENVLALGDYDAQKRCCHFVIRLPGNLPHLHGGYLPIHLAYRVGGSSHATLAGKRPTVYS